MDPFYALSHVLLLFLLQDQLNEQLLQLLVAIVDAQLLKTAVGKGSSQLKPQFSGTSPLPVVIKDLKPVDVKNSDDTAVACLGNFDLQLTVDTPDNPSEQSLVHSLEEHTASDHTPTPTKTTPTLAKALRP